MKRLLAMAVSLCLLLGIAPAASAAAYGGAHTISLSSEKTADGYRHAATCDGASVEEFDYTWHADPGEAHDEVKNAPAEYYTGTKPDTGAAVYIAHDITYYPKLPENGFQRVNYDGEQEWVYYYPAEEYADYIFATLPVSGNSVPTSMMHTEAEAYENAVLHITQAGTYILKGEWRGQIWIDLGDTGDTFADENAKVTLILSGVDVTCTVAPALVFYSVYECDNAWEEQSSWSRDVDTSNAGANVIIADGTVNNFTGENVYRMLKTTYKDGQEGRAVPVQKKLRKLDGAFYSYVSMNIDGEAKGTGVLNITAGFEGLDTELHLTVNGGNINIFSQDDGMNVNEDGVSVITFNGGSTHVLAGLGSEGDGIDSNGYIVVNGGTVIALAKPNSDSGMDSDSGTYINGGTVVALGSAMDYARPDGGTAAGQAVMNLQFASPQSADEAIIVTDTGGKVVFAYDPDKDEVAGSNARWYRGAIVSAPGLQAGGNYYVYVGGDVTGTETEGVYDAATVTGFSSGAKQQSYGSAGALGGRGGMRPDGDDPDFPKGDGQMPMGEFGPGRRDGRMPDGRGEFDPGQGRMPWDRGDGFTPGEGPGDGFAPPEIPDGGMGPGGGGADSQGGEITFTMTERVNSFSGVTDYLAGSGTAEPVPSDPVPADTPSSDTAFSDVAASAYYSDAVSWAIEHDVTTGYAGGTFRPDSICTRAQVMTFLWRASGSPNPVSAENPFTDLSADAYYYKAVLWAVEKGITGGTTATTFSPDQACTRAQTMTFLYRAGGSPAPGGNVTFSDVSSNSYYSSAVSWAAANGITTGYAGGAFAPNATCTRANIMTFLYRYFEK